MSDDPWQAAIDGVRQCVEGNAARIAARQKADGERTLTEILTRLSGDPANPCRDAAAENQSDIVAEAAKALGVTPGSWRTPEFNARLESELAKARKETK